MMTRPDRRAFLAAVAGALTIALADASEAQQTRMSRVGVLTDGNVGGFRDSLRALGYIEGQNVALDVRLSEGRTDRLEKAALELAQLNVDVIVAFYPAAAIAASRASGTIPIVMVNTPDPVDLGLVTSLARPGRNITGLTTVSVEMSLKQLELLKEAVPRAARIAVLWNPDNPWHPITMKGLQGRGRSLRLELQLLAIRGPAEFDKAYQAMLTKKAQAVVLLADPMTFVHRGQLTALAVKHGLPLVGGPRSYAEAGSLLAYWADNAELVGRAASYVDKILKGAQPATLPIEQPTKFELVINLKTAKALGLTIPPSLLQRADRVIE